MLFSGSILILDVPGSLAKLVPSNFGWLGTKSMSQSNYDNVGLFLHHILSF
jgi:hypothetical protein